MSTKDFFKFALEIDTSGLKCPLPILRTKKALAQIKGGETLKVITTDPHAKKDFQAFAGQTGHELLSQQEQAEQITHYLRKRAD